MSSPEQEARQQIDAMLIASGWHVQNFNATNLAAGRGVAVREFPLKKGHGFADYMLYVDRKAAGVVEAKKVGHLLTGAELQTEKYSVGLPDKLPFHVKPLPFLYQSTGSETRFTNGLDPDPASRDVFTFHRPETLAELLKLPNVSGLKQVADQKSSYPAKETLLSQLQSMPPLNAEGMRDCQIDAITNLEKSLADNRRRALIQMQTGSGKTYTAVAQTYRLLRFGGAKRILFLVDRGNLAEQTLGEFQQYVTPDDGRKFTELYNAQYLQSNKIDDASSVVITTIQRLYSILKGEAEFDPSKEEESTASAFARFQKEPLPVVYNAEIPIETVDFIFTDECHRSIYNLWRQVLEYFDSYLIGLTATPSKQTLGYFNQNLVTEYTHAQAVADKVNVDFDVYRINTQITSLGATVESGLVIDKRDRKSRKVRWQALDDDLTYTPNQLDRAVVAVDQIRTIVREFKNTFLPTVFPERTWVPKTLIFAKDDSHAEDIVRIVREEFGKGNDFCVKITYRASTAKIVDPVTGEETFKSTNVKAKDLLSAFKASPYPRIAVTVDMIATGTDIKPLEIVMFMRDVASANYFEQMKGRGCRVMTPTEFKGVTPDANNKSRYVIVDAVGVTEHARKDTSPSLNQQPTVPLKTVLTAVGAGASEPEVVSTLASRLSRLDKVIGDGVRKQIETIAGTSIADLVSNLIHSVEPGDYESEIPTNAELVTEQEARERALEPFLNPELRNLILIAQSDAEQTIDTVSKDAVIYSGLSEEAKEKAKATITSFREYIEANKDELDAIQILYSRRKGQSPTFKQLKELAAAIGTPPRSWTPEGLWQAYEALEQAKVKGHGGKMVTDLVSLVRFALEQETVLAPFAESVDDRFQHWLTSQNTPNTRFTAEQVEWLTMIKDHIASSLRIEPDHFEYQPFVQMGGFGRARQVFGADLPEILRDLNEVLVA